MRQTISGLVAAIAVITVSAAPAMACGGVFGSCYAPVTVYAGCDFGCWPRERLPDPVAQYGAVPHATPQYYYVDQGPTYSGPGNFAPYPVYREGTVSGWTAYRRSVSYGHAPRHRQPVLRRYY